ncbi:MAG: hypothetical protein CL840_02205 [Crocinitomicaceae bacterium]|nr:hypothetical protein [Crocinitomicaceae bacterium]|tara:strand:+ start:7001 stop:7396 length:396 start_codon:yes stop_codon:yes gene_type:complete
MKTIKSITIIQAILFRLFSKIAILAISFALLVLYSKIILGQSCEISYTVILENRKGGFYAGQKIAFYSKSGELKFEQTSNAKGTAEFTLPCNSTYDLRVSNYTGSKEVRIPSFNGAQMKKRMSYEPDMIAK